MSVICMPVFDALEQYHDHDQLDQYVHDVPNHFLEPQQLTPVNTNDAEKHLEFATAFVQNSQLDHVTQVMGFHPRYLQAFQAMRQFLLQGDGPLPFDQRHYIAIMAAARHHCSYIVYQSATAFLLCDGNPAWLRGLDHAPQRLRNLSELNKLMAHRPWLINKSHFETLLKASDDSWSLSELMHAVVLMAHFHTLSSFVHGCGLMPEVCQIDGHYYGSCPTNGFALMGKPSLEEVLDYDGILISKEGAIEVLMERMQRLAREADKLQLTEAELLNNFQTIGSQCADLPAGIVIAAPKADITCFIDDEDFTYEDFAKRDPPSDIPTFRVEDYSWEDQGYSLASKLYLNMGDLLDNRFKIAYSLTYRTMGNEVDVDTSAFRRAVWYYIQTLYGIRHDDYDYSVVNQLLERDLKAYMKMVTCYPERITKLDYDSCMQEFKHSEKVHVNVMLMEARQQAEMLYTLRALTQYMT